jgi:hypothetical protein
VAPPQRLPDIWSENISEEDHIMAISKVDFSDRHHGHQ